MADLLERRHVVSLLYASVTGARRFTEFRQAVRGIPPRTLAERLRDLEAAGVLERRLVPAKPPYAEYRLTPRGSGVAALVRALAPPGG